MPTSYAAMADILLAVAPNQPVSGQDLANEDLSLGESHPHYCWLNWNGDTPAGFFTAAEATWDRSPGRFRVYAAVVPRWQDRGAGRELWNHCLSALLAQHEVTELTCDTRPIRNAESVFCRTGGSSSGRPSNKANWTSPATTQPRNRIGGTACSHRASGSCPWTRCQPKIPTGSGNITSCVWNSWPTWYIRLHP